MNDFQNKFMSIVQQAYTANQLTAARYAEDAGHIADNFMRETEEITRVKINRDTITNRNKLRIFFDETGTRYSNELKKHTLNFAAETRETFESYDKKLINLFTEEGVSGKEIYDRLERHSDDTAALVNAKICNMQIRPALVSEAQEKIVAVAGGAVKNTSLKKLLLGVFLPFAIIALVVAGLVAFSNRNAEAEVENDPATVVQVARFALRTVGIVPSAALNPVVQGVIAVLVVSGVWVVYFLILSRVLKNKLHVNLESKMSGIYEELRNRKPELQGEYSAFLTTLMNEMNEVSFMRYKPLIESRG
jgi:uncharacterized membrane protein